MLKTLEESCRTKYHIYVFAFDQDTFIGLKRLNLPNVTPISLGDFENTELLNVKKERTKQEYCWTCTPSTIFYCIQKFKLDQCTYIDADLMFMQDPKILLDEMPANKSILLTEHRYTPKYDQTDQNGIYCVQFISFKNDTNGIRALDWWREKCIDWCYAIPDKGRFGDQKYLDNWLSMFEGVHVLQHLGGGIAPWNVQQYAFFSENDQVYGMEFNTKREFKTVFYHFHDFKLLEDGWWGHSGNYDIFDSVYFFFYRPYLFKLLEFEKLYENIRTDKVNLPENLETKFSKEILSLFGRLNRREDISYGLSILNRNRTEDVKTELVSYFIKHSLRLTHADNIYNIERRDNIFDPQKYNASIFFPAERNTTYWNRRCEVQPFDFDTSFFKIRFNLKDLGVNLSQISWAPVKWGYVSIRIESIEFRASEDKENLKFKIAVKGISHNGIRRAGGWVDFLRLNPVFMNIPVPETAEILYILGQWKWHSPDELGERVFQEIKKNPIYWLNYFFTDPKAFLQKGLLRVRNLLN
ncbi:hypothetical protein [Leptospira fletcheri]|uniref:hypothetical protein n=1 Tax=Leptospira fletcheri TaxID=2484981 RepID=UPI001FE9B003|nr:hypothetical protein [Leptospira fletcheri]